MELNVGKVLSYTSIAVLTVLMIFMAIYIAENVTDTQRGVNFASATDSWIAYNGSTEQLSHTNITADSETVTALNDTWLDFDGDYDYITATAYNASQNFSVSFWAKWDGESNGSWVVNNGYAGSRNESWGVRTGLGDPDDLILDFEQALNQL